MLKFWKKKKPQAESSSQSTQLVWDPQAEAALNQAAAQAPIPKLLRSTVIKQMRDAAETAAREAGRTTVTAADLMTGLLSKVPPAMRAKIEDTLKNNPEDLKKLQKDLLQH